MLKMLKPGTGFIKISLQWALGVLIGFLFFVSPPIKGVTCVLEHSQQQHLQHLLWSVWVSFVTS
jgi:hypothetical protein